jgi:hypothetical protein
MSDDLVKRLRMKDEYLPLGHDGWEAADRIEKLEAKLAKFAKAATRVHDSYWNSTDGVIVGMFDLGEALRETRITLAELKGDKT